MSGEAWTDALENELTFARIFARNEFWAENPPLVSLVRCLAIGIGVWTPDADKHETGRPAGLPPGM